MADTRLTILSPDEADATYTRKGDAVTAEQLAGALSPVAATAAAAISPTQLRVAQAGARRSHVTVFLGDSNFIIQSNPATGSFGFSVPSRVAALSRGRLILARNAGVASDTSRLMLARLESDVFAYSPGRVFIQAGSNDVTKGQAHFDDARIAYRQIIEACLARGVEVILGEIPPRGAGLSTGSRDNPEVYRFVEMWNTYIRETSVEYRLRMSDTYSAVAGIDGDWLPLFASDKTHWTSAGVEAAAARIWESIADLYPVQIVPFERSRYSTINLCQDPLVLGPFSFGSAGRFPLSFSGSSAATMAISAVDPVAGDGLARGKWLKAEMTGTGSTNLNMIRTLASFATSSGIPIAAGHRALISYLYKIEGLTGSTPYVTFSVNFRDSGGAILKSVTPVSQYPRAASGAVHVEEVIPDGTVDIRLDWGKATTADTATIYVGQVTVYDLTAMGVRSFLGAEPQPVVVMPTLGTAPSTVVVTPETPTPTAPVAVTPGAVVTSDSFDRADTAAGTMGVTDNALGGSGARTWTNVTQPQILGNAVGGTVTTTRYPGVTLDAATANMRATVKIPATSAALSGGVWVRGTDAAVPVCYTAYVTAGGGVQIAKVDSSTTALGSPAPADSIKLGDRLGLSAIGSTLTAYVNDVPVVSVTDSSITSGTRVGLRVSTNSDARRLDDFVVTAS